MQSLTSLSNKNVNSYLSQTKSTSMKCKPKIFYIKNDYSYMKKNSLPYKIEISRTAKKKSLDKIISIEEKENDNEKNISNNKIILPIIENKNNPNNNKENSESLKNFMGRIGKNTKSYIGHRRNYNRYNNTHYIEKIKDNMTINNSEFNNLQISTPKYNNFKLKFNNRNSESIEYINKNESPVKIQNNNNIFKDNNKNVVLKLNKINK